MKYIQQLDETDCGAACIAMNNFVELNEKEMIEINGGGWGTVIVGGVFTVLGIVAAVASCGTAIPAYGAILQDLVLQGGVCYNYIWCNDRN